MVCGGSGRVLKLVCGWLCLYEIRKTNQVHCWVRFLVALFAGPKISACHGAMGNELFGSRYGSFSSLTPPGIWAI